MIEAAEVVSQPLDYAVLATNVGIFLGFVVAAILGVKKGLDTFKKGAEGSLAQGSAHVAAATLLGTESLNQWTDANLEMVEAIRQHTETIERNTQELIESRRAIYAHREEAAELRHQIERVRDRMNP